MKKNKFPVRSFSIIAIVLSALMWVALFFIGYFFASQLLFYIIAFLLLIFIYFFTSKVSKRLALALSAITFIVLVGVFLYGFEEDYCTDKGNEADSTGSKMIFATRDDAKKLNGFDVKEGDEIGVNFNTHMMCHESFDLIELIEINIP